MLVRRLLRHNNKKDIETDFFSLSNKSQLDFCAQFCLGFQNAAKFQCDRVRGSD